MSSVQARGAPRTHDRRPRGSYHVDFPAKARSRLDAATFTVHRLEREPGDEAVSLWACRYPDGSECTVAESPDGNKCDCPRFTRDGECPHVDRLEGLNAIRPADRFTLSAGGEP